MTKRPVAPVGKSAKTPGHRLPKVAQANGRQLEERPLEERPLEDRNPESVLGSARAVAAPSSRIDRLVALADHCMAARALAEGLEENFLVHLLAMAIQEARTTMQRTGTGEPGSVRE